jgi:hypothetical protein
VTESSINIAHSVVGCEPAELHYSRARQPCASSASRGRLWHLQQEKSARDIPRPKDNNFGGDAEVHMDEILYKCGVKSVENLRILGFYMGDDKYKEIVEKLPQLAAVASELMSEEVLEVDGVKCIFKVTFIVMLGGLCVFCRLYVHY